jgi:hypothetical protein
MVRTLIAACSLLLFTAAAAGPARADDDKNKCTIAVKGDNDVVKACQAGGRKRAKLTMKGMVKIAKDKSPEKKDKDKWNCDGCHKNEEEWTLLPDVEKRFKEMLALTAGAK